MCNKRFFLKIFVLLISLAGANSLVAQEVVKPEFRGVWIATVDNIDWPERAGMTSEEQRSSFIKLLDLHAANGINAVVVQVRPATDAFYPSPFEPWSQWLTGKQGLAPFQCAYFQCFHYTYY